MTGLEQALDEILNKRPQASLVIETFGSFKVWVEGRLVMPKDFGRSISIDLLQFLVTSRKRKGLHKEQIIDRLWEIDDPDIGNRDFKIALYGINKALEPDRKSRVASKYINSDNNIVSLIPDHLWIDTDYLEDCISLGNAALADDKDLAIQCYKSALLCYNGAYLPSAIYSDWSSSERERLRVSALGATVTLAELLLEVNPLESIRLSQQALLIDSTWEEAYRIQIAALIQQGNRPQAIKTYQTCCEMLDKEFGLRPLPNTRRLIESIK